MQRSLARDSKLARAFMLDNDATFIDPGAGGYYVFMLRV